MERIQLKSMRQRSLALARRINSENQGTQTDDDNAILAYPRGTQTEAPAAHEPTKEQDLFIKLVERISISPEPVARPSTIFSNIRKPTYFTSSISSSLLIGATKGNN